MAPPYKLSRIRGRPVVHLLALLCAGLLVFGVKVQDFNLNELIWPIDNWHFKVFTPYYPGLNNLQEHELFDPEYRSKKKIVVLGASAADSIGCDASWSVPDKNQDPPQNAHSSCSITGQLNDLLREEGYSGWRAFNLARNGASLTPMLYTYSRAMEVKPDVIVWGETFPYYMFRNAGAADLPAKMYAHLDAVFDHTSTKALWQSYRQTIAHGDTSGNWTLPPYAPAALLPSENHLRAKTSLLDLVSLEFTKARGRLNPDMPSRPTQLYPNWRKFQPLVPDTLPFANPDPQFAYFQGFGLIGTLQKEAGHQMVMYFLPQYDYRSKLDYLRMLSDNGPLAHYLNQYGIGHKSLVDLPLKPVEQTYDGVHQTRAGNHVIAIAILNDLIARHIVTRN